MHPQINSATRRKVITTAAWSTPLLVFPITAPAIASSGGSGSSGSSSSSSSSSSWSEETGTTTNNNDSGTSSSSSSSASRTANTATATPVTTNAGRNSQEFLIDLMVFTPPNSKLLADQIVITKISAVGISRPVTFMSVPKAAVKVRKGKATIVVHAARPEKLKPNRTWRLDYQIKSTGVVIGLGSFQVSF